MIPLYKAFSLLIRVFSRPLINYTKKMHSNNTKQDSRLRIFFIWFGNFYHRVDSQINRKFLKIQSQFAYKPLNDQLALQKGIQFFYQIIFYTIVIGLPLYEMNRASQQSLEKSNQTEYRLKNIQNQISNILNQVEKIKEIEQNNLKIQSQNLGVKLQSLRDRQKYCFPHLKLSIADSNFIISPYNNNSLIEYKLCLL